jgi:hypothetical protein
MHLLAEKGFWLPALQWLTPAGLRVPCDGNAAAQGCWLQCATLQVPRVVSHMQAMLSTGRALAPSI